MTSEYSPAPLSRLFARMVALALLAMLLLLPLNRYLLIWHDWPDLSGTADILSGVNPKATNLELVQGLILSGTYLLALGFVLLYVFSTTETRLREESRRFAGWAFYLLRAAFWVALLVGLADASIALLRTEALTPPGVSLNAWLSLDQTAIRSLVIHTPLIVLALLLAWFIPPLAITWLALLVVLIEFAIVLLRFVFAYEQPFLTDLVRFWYAALFLFAAVYTLVEDGHARLEVLYSRLGERGKAWVNALGSLLLGLPLCWMILLIGLDTQESSLAQALLPQTIPPGTTGMYAHYLMAGFLPVFAVAMGLVFISYFLYSCADLAQEADMEEDI